MLRILLFAVLAAGVAVTVPPLVGSALKTGSPVTDGLSDDPMPSTTGVLRKPAASYAGGDTVELTADPRGHFFGTFRINGRRVEGLIDTGASFVAINRSTARKLGVAVAASDFRYRVATANGIVLAAPVVLRRVEYQSIRVDDVEALVLDDDALGITLIGMSFLNRLGSFQARDGKLTLRR